MIVTIIMVEEKGVSGKVNIRKKKGENKRKKTKKEKQRKTKLKSSFLKKQIYKYV